MENVRRAVQSWAWLFYERNLGFDTQANATSCCKIEGSATKDGNDVERKAQRSFGR